VFIHVIDMGIAKRIAMPAPVCGFGAPYRPAAFAPLLNTAIFLIN
jgi:hypothetical protein